MVLRVAELVAHPVANGWPCRWSAKPLILRTLWGAGGQRVALGGQRVALGGQRVARMRRAQHRPPTSWLLGWVLVSRELPALGPLERVELEQAGSTDMAFKQSSRHKMLNHRLNRPRDFEGQFNTLLVQRGGMPYPKNDYPASWVFLALP